jgi:hypothetical protein
LLVVWGKVGDAARAAKQPMTASLFFMGDAPLKNVLIHRRIQCVTGYGDRASHRRNSCKSMHRNCQISWVRRSSVYCKKNRL